MSTPKKFYKEEDLIGKIVVGQDAFEVGTVKGTAFDAEGKLALIVTKKGNKGEDYVSINDIKAFGDCVLLKGPTAQATDMSSIPPPAPATAKICPKCGATNRLSVSFCTKCGAKLT